MSHNVEGDEDTVMGEPRPMSLSSHHVSLTRPPAPSQHHIQQRADPILTPSLLPSIVKSPSPGDISAPGGMQPPDRTIKTSDSESTSAEHYLPRNDSLIEQNSDWSDEENDPGLPLGSMATGLCYDVRMRYHCEVRPLSDMHPEDPRRIYYIYKELCKAGLVDDPDSSRPLAPQTLKRIPIREATEEEIRLIHTEAHYAFVHSTKGIISPSDI